MKNRVNVLIPIIVLGIGLGACGTMSNGESTSSTATSQSASTLSSSSSIEESSSSTTKKTSTTTEEYFSEQDLNAHYDSNTSTHVQLSGATASVTGQGATVEGSIITIHTAGTYILSGTSEGVQMKVEVADSEKVQLVLDNVTMTGTEAPLVIEEAERVYITLAEGSQNTFSDASEHTNKDEDAVIFSKSDLTFNGTGSLTVTGNYEHAIKSNDDLRIIGGTYAISSTEKHAFSVNDALNIKDATLVIDAAGDGLHSENEEDAGLGNIYIHQATLTIQAGDDAINASNALVIDSGTIDITHSLEGLEGTSVTIKGGDVTIISNDDGINASANSVDETANVFIAIHGGNINLTVGSGDTDAFDSNGDLIVSGGEINITAVSAFDFDGTVEYTGGTVIVNGVEQSTIVKSPPPQGNGN